MKKSSVLQSIISELRQEFANYQEISRKTRSTGNDAQTKSEGKYDTRSTEENYLADGQAKQARQAMDAAIVYEKMLANGVVACGKVETGALLQLDMSGESRWFFVGPTGGGLEVANDGCLVTLVTPESPLIRQLSGMSVGGQSTSPPAKVLQIL